MKTFSPVSWLRKAFLGVLLAVFAASPAWASKYASIVVDLETNQVLHARDADEERHPASLTKVMTLYLVFEALDSGKLKLSERMTVSNAAAKQQPSKLGLKAGSTIKVEDAIRALVTKSANDVAVVLAEKLAGTESKFVTKMNSKAKELGLGHTTFRNSSGLPDRRQVTTARDMAKLAEAMFYDHKDRYNYFSLPSFTWNKRRYENHNTLLKAVEGVDGIKTGYTNASGYNLMASAERNGRRVIAVMLGGTSGKSRDQHVSDLLEAAFLEISGAPATSMADLRNRISFGAKANTSADDLALAQLRKLTESEASLVVANDPALVAALDQDFGGTTEEGNEDGLEVAEGDAENGIDGSEISETAAAPAPAGLLTPASDEASGASATPAAETIAVTSEYIPGVMTAFASDSGVLELSRP
jgi:D-alanyl-D-alanine carboxypeptidase